MKKNKIIISVFSVVSLVFSSFASVTIAEVDPPEVNAVMAIGESIETDKTVTTTAIFPPSIDICLLVDETGSFDDDIANLKTAAPAIYNIISTSSDAQFAVAGFRDYPVLEYGITGDWVYHLLSPMNPNELNWTNGVNALTAYGGWDFPEAQYDAIVAAAGPSIFVDPTLGEQESCGWRDDPNVKRVLIVATDAPFHGQDGTHQNNHATTLAALGAQNITVVGLKADSAGGELDALADETGGNVQPLSNDGANIAEAILAGISLPVTVTPVPVGCDPLEVTFIPTSRTVTSGSPAEFIEEIAVPNNPLLGGTIQSCIVEFWDDSGEYIGEQDISITIPDTTPPEISCVESVNPHGKKIPPAGSTTLPGSKGGMNEDGFYELIAEDLVDLNSEIYVIDAGSGTVFGPFASGIVIKYTEDADAVPEQKKMGSGKDKAGAVSWHIIGNGDMEIQATDSAGNVSSATCLVPPFPK